MSNEAISADVSKALTVIPPLLRSFIRQASSQVKQRCIIFLDKDERPSYLLARRSNGTYHIAVGAVKDESIHLT
jgi:hypothetical protein